MPADAPPACWFSLAVRRCWRRSRCHRTRWKYPARGHRVHFLRGRSSRRHSTLRYETVRLAELQRTVCLPLLRCSGRSRCGDVADDSRCRLVIRSDTADTAASDGGSFHTVDGIGRRSFLLEMGAEGVALCVFDRGYYLQISALGLRTAAQVAPAMESIARRAVMRFARRRRPNAGAIFVPAVSTIPRMSERSGRPNGAPRFLP